MKKNCVTNNIIDFTNKFFPTPELSHQLFALDGTTLSFLVEFFVLSFYQHGKESITYIGCDGGVIRA